MSPSIDLYCRVVDNFGDAGICWRLARQLAREHRCRIRLIIDKPDYVLRLLACTRQRQTPFEEAGVKVLDWADPPGCSDLPDVVIAAFQCQLPAPIGDVLERAQFGGQPLWVNLDYLSAESWVDDAHGLPSHKPSGGTEWFYLPGFTLRSGGLIRERDAQSSSNRSAVEPSWLPVRRPDALRVSLFCYTGQKLNELITAWNNNASSAIGRPLIDLLITAGCDVDDVRRELGIAAGARQAEFGVVRASFLPWITQLDYDRLLAGCDLNFVRGEDSWIRAIWAGKPFIWRPYPQNDGADRVKLTAFVERCRVDFDDVAFNLLDPMSHAWSLNEGVAKFWPGWLENREALAHGFAQMRDRIGSQQDQASRLLAFIKPRLL